MVIYHSDGLHLGVDHGGADEAESRRFKPKFQPRNGLKIETGIYE
jgi:hypothetical protein